MVSTDQGNNPMSPVDGSTSLRTGLSSVQVDEGDEEMNGSTSMRTGVMNLRSVEGDPNSQSPRPGSQHQYRSQQGFQFPETIIEEEEDSSGFRKPMKF